MTIAELAALLGIPCPEELRVLKPSGFSIDSRTVRPGDLFFAIHGKRFDAHAFVPEVLARGACAAVIHRDLPELGEQAATRCLRVTDTLRAMQDLAQALLRQWGRPIVGITGSMGKTTAKDLTELALAPFGRIYASVGNLNNEYGLPLAVFNMLSDGRRMDDYDLAILEMGMNEKGEIARLCEIAPPDVSVVLNVAPVHIENFPDGLEGIAAAKAEIVHGLKPEGTAILNADDPRVARMAAIVLGRRQDHAGAQVMYFGRCEAAHVTALDVEPRGLLGTTFTLSTLKGTAVVEFPLAGEHHVSNALAAAAVATHFGVSPEAIARQLKQARPGPHRGVVRHYPGGVTVVDDTYNSNPAALVEAVRLLGQVPDATRRIVIAGEMRELGGHAVEMHLACGVAIAQSGVDILLGVAGHARDLVEAARAENARRDGRLVTAFVETAADAGDWLVKQAQAGDVILIKGSRGVRLETCLEALPV
ncbi:MAG: UDP-N-acetylmuramoyl-tripeptide--D-alanyl-D-alanine ligase [Chloracidobacterium sp.]|uniref:UDP-N-acetylmuramoyl-tripeptide--D-alanyl-D-alanine ligase n=1 Tax=Chloracidobacterium validum TaxID=2821543 RepID=A0ABX8B9H4_9BACT|nr:UDP-N-acetylmuramoyl-tripeptide--D-alanyl-D-alanine ligase [Chloracidobacterium validum]QUW03528.1 UDP-N-acetylmuramoyl-tripeptide--D-alanyl-D-alanine ligase [Chloracidobacterium validum]